MEEVKIEIGDEIKEINYILESMIEDAKITYEYEELLKALSTIRKISQSVKDSYIRDFEGTDRTIEYNLFSNRMRIVLYLLK